MYLGIGSSEHRNVSILVSTNTWEALAHLPLPTECCPTLKDTHTIPKPLHSYLGCTCLPLMSTQELSFPSLLHTHTHTAIVPVMTLGHSQN